MCVHCQPYTTITVLGWTYGVWWYTDCLECRIGRSRERYQICCRYLHIYRVVCVTLRFNADDGYNIWNASCVTSKQIFWMVRKMSHWHFISCYTLNHLPWLGPWTAFMKPSVVFSAMRAAIEHRAFDPTNCSNCLEAQIINIESTWAGVIVSDYGRAFIHQ